MRILTVKNKNSGNKGRGEESVRTNLVINDQI